MDLRLSDRVYLLTGGTSGLGLAAARALVAEGARVVVCGRDPQRLASAVHDLGGAPHAAGIVASIETPRTPRRLLDTARERFGRVDGALLSTGSTVRAGVSEATDQQWREHFERLFLGVTRAATQITTELGSGSALALVLSTSARAPLAEFAISTGLRPGLAMLARLLAAEAGPRGVRVLSLVPGRFDTAGAPVSAGEDVTHVPLGRAGDSDEFGRLAAFCLSPAAGYLTGTEVVLDGGRLAAAG